MTSTPHRRLPPDDPRIRASQNGARKPSSLDILSVIAGGVQALAQDATRRPVLPPGQRVQCAICLGGLKAWEQKHRAALEALRDEWEQAEAAFQAAWLEFGQRAGEIQQAGPVPDDVMMGLASEQQGLLDGRRDLMAMAMDYGDKAKDPKPPVYEMVTIATVAPFGPCAVCPQHVPLVGAEVGRKPFLIANRPLSTGLLSELAAQ
jgi:hypothetical protein